MAFTLIAEKQVGSGFIRRYLVDSESDLAILPKDTAPASVAHTSGYVDNWEKGHDGSWTRISNGGGGGGADIDWLFGSDNGYPYIQEV